MKKGMANYYYLCLAITWCFKKEIKAQVLETLLGARGEERQLLQSQATGCYLILIRHLLISHNLPYFPPPPPKKKKKKKLDKHCFQFLLGRL